MALDVERSGEAQIGPVEPRELREHALGAVDVVDHARLREVAIAGEGDDLGSSSPAYV